jgi:hypothetical protein
MDSYINNQIALFGVVLIVFAIIIFSLSKLNKAEKLGCFFTLFIFLSLFSIPRIIGLKYFSSEVIGTTTGITTPLKSGKTINYTFSYNGKNYSGGNVYRDSVKVKGGRYKVIVSDLILVNSWMDFSQQIE